MKRKERNQIKKWIEGLSNEELENKYYEYVMLSLAIFMAMPLGLFNYIYRIVMKEV